MDETNLNQIEGVWTPASLFNKYKTSSVKHVHDFRQCQAFLPLNKNEINTDHNIPETPFATSTTKKHSAVIGSTQSNLLWTSRFLCHVCHVWLCIASSSSQHTCSSNGFATHHYHLDTTSTTTATQSYLCCGCKDQVELSYLDSTVPAQLLLDLTSTRIPTGTGLLSTSSTGEPTMTSTLTTCQIYINDLLGSTRRNINSQNRLFLQRIGLDNTTKRLLELIGFTHQNDFFMAPQEIDNDRLYMIREELEASIRENRSLTTTGNDSPLATTMILCDLLGCNTSIEFGDQNKSTGLKVAADAYDLLGITPSATDDLIVWAYQQRIHEQPKETELPALQDAFKTISIIKGSEALGIEVSKQHSKGSTSKQKDVDNAYRYFGVEKDIDDETLLIAYQCKVQDRSRQLKTHAEKLKIIGEARGSMTILQHLDNGTALMKQGSKQKGILLGPVGLTNIGNTCYLNSLLQYYYTLAPLRTTITHKDSHMDNEYSTDGTCRKVGGVQVDQSGIKRATKFIDLLQGLFTQLENTADKEIAPSLTLAKMALLIDDEKDGSSSSLNPSTKNTNIMTLGKQQDVTECMDNMMYLLEAALTPQKTDDMVQSQNLIRHLFYGKSRQILSYKDATTAQHTQNLMEESFSHVIVDAVERKTLYDGLNEYFFANKVENFQGGQEAIREVTAIHLPPVLQIQIQRVQFDRATHRTYKSNAFVPFDQTIYLDRYLDSNHHQLGPRRAKVEKWTQQRAQCQEKIKELSVDMETTTPGKSVDVPMSWILEKAASVLGEFEPTTDSRFGSIDVINAVNRLIQVATNNRKSLQEYTERMDDYDSKIRHEYDDLTDCAYQLHAVFMHRGEATYGHYWIYILDHVTKCWWKFNDSLVTKVGSSEVFKDTTSTNANPYLLVYIKSDSIDSLSTMSFGKS